MFCVHCLHANRMAMLGSSSMKVAKVTGAGILQNVRNLCRRASSAPVRSWQAAESATQEPAFKKARLNVGSGQAAFSGAFASMEPFEQLKAVLHGLVASAGQKGVSSGKLGYDLGADRKAITAALYSCQSEGKVMNTTEGGKPHWVSCIEPPPDTPTQLPDRYGYKGTKGLQEPVKQAKPCIAVSPVVPPSAGGGGGAAIDNPIGMLNEYGQKNSQKIDFADLGSGPGGFRCQVTMSGRQIAVESGRNKKAAKTAAATAALRALGLA
eukprot:TRINITY_DN23498_c0_g1_i2.p1 TRINITY_DN23498_c0_g1~~TRINITY_DN23498_c0_g1_i2.p1  ORF type:complete len:267 (+),score=50.42 TRINITY_DN23498_c0_g1_i2:186-986(+)